jgi:SET domain-containing protein
VVTVALRDLAAGEELTCDYHAFDAEAPAKLGS